VSVDGDLASPMSTDAQIDDALPGEIPGWLQRLAALGWRILVVVAIVIVVAAVAVRLSTVTASIIFATLVAATIAPAYRTVRMDRDWSATKAALVMSLVALTALAAIATLVVLTFAPYVSEFVTSVRTGVAAVTAYATSAGLPEQVVALLGLSIQNAESSITDAIASFAGPIAEAVTVVILGGFLTFYVLHDYEKAWGLLIRDLDERPAVRERRSSCWR